MVEGVIMDQAKWLTDSFIAFSAYNVTEFPLSEKKKIK